MDNIIAIASAVFYVIAIATIVPGLFNQTGINAKIVLACAIMALFFHFWGLGELILYGNGQNLSILNVASLVSFIITLLMTLSLLRMRVWFLLPIVYCFSAINIVAAAYIPSTFMRHLGNHLPLLIHISLALFSYAILIIGALYAVQLAWLDFKLKQKKALAINPNLPPLLMVERQLFRIILFGNVLLTGTLITGLFFVQELVAQGKIHKGILSFVAWIIYSILLWGHYQRGWRGRKVTGFSILGAIILTLAYFGSRFVNEFILR